jgi:tetratricopeptide (TPR) repeat protein
MTPSKDNRGNRGDRRHQPGRGRDADRDPRRRKERDADRTPRRGERRSIAAVPAGGELPKWVRDEINRTTPKDRREPAITHLSRGVADFADERYGAAFEQLKRAKDLAPQAATIRELLGLSAYHLERWEEALRELRTFRRISGEASQVPVELDCLRALGRPEDVEKTYRRLQQIEHYPETDDEARVVFASSLLDRGLVADAWKIIKPGRLVANARPSALRRWFVAARVAVAGDETEAARRFASAIADQEPDFPGLDELQAEIASKG